MTIRTVKKRCNIVDTSTTLPGETIFKRGKKKALLYCHIWSICKYQAAFQKEKKNHNMLTIFLKNEFKKDPRGRILGSVKNDGHALNTCNCWGLISWMSQFLKTRQNWNRDVRAECGKEKYEYQNGLEDSMQRGKKKGEKWATFWFYAKLETGNMKLPFATQVRGQNKKQQNKLKMLL